MVAIVKYVVFVQQLQLQLYMYVLGGGRSTQASSAQQLAFDCVSASPLKIDVNFMIPLKSEYKTAYVSFSKDLLLCV